MHPGETPAAHVLEGFLAFLLKEGDPRAKALRERFVFKLVPMINPDGVFRGRYRADTRGVNLNRCYLANRPETHPSVHAIAAVVRQLHSSGQLMFYVDTHAHATKRGCFLYGNALGKESEERMVDNVLYAKLVAANCRWFDFGGCVFTERNMYGKDKRDGLSKGSGRVAVYKMTDLTFVYTLECNYNTGRVVNRLQPPHAEASTRRTLTTATVAARGPGPKYTPESWKAVGRALAIAALDVLAVNPHAHGSARPRTTGCSGCAQRCSHGCALTSEGGETAATRAAKHAGSDDDDDDDDGAEVEEEEEEEEEDRPRRESWTERRRRQLSTTAVPKAPIRVTMPRLAYEEAAALEDGVDPHILPLGLVRHAGGHGQSSRCTKPPATTSATTSQTVELA